MRFTDYMLPKGPRTPIATLLHRLAILEHFIGACDSNGASPGVIRAAHRKLAQIDAELHARGH
jgi:hypothetical protein